MDAVQAAYLNWKASCAKPVRERLEALGLSLLQAIRLNRSADAICGDFVKDAASQERSTKFVTLFAAVQEARLQSKSLPDRNRAEAVLDAIQAKVLRDPFAMQSYQQMTTNQSNYYQMLSNMLNAQTQAMTGILRNFR